MRAVNNWQRRRAERRARMIAAARRRHLEQLLESGPYQSQPANATAPSRNGRAVTVLWSGIFALTVAIGLGVGGPFFGTGWEPVPLLVAGALALLAGGESARRLSDSDLGTKLTALLVVVLTAVSFTLGIRGQVTIQERPQWRYSDAAEASQLAIAIRDDLYILQENQSLFSYPPEQARSMLAYYQSAARQAEMIATRWNPATAPNDLPLPGFLVVLEKVNSAADLQRQALVGYADYVRQPDVRLGEQVQATATAAEQNYLAAAQELARIVTPLGIELTDGGS